MSQYYDVGARTIWNPSNGVSRLFMGQAALHETELGLPSGIGPMRSDECQINPVEFKVFTDALLARHQKAHHPAMNALSDGFVATVLVLTERAGIEVRWPSSAAPTEEARMAALQQKSRELDRSIGD